MKPEWSWELGNVNFLHRANLSNTMFPQEMVLNNEHVVVQKDWFGKVL